MNFFDAQDRARRSTRWLVIVYLIATALIVAGITLIVAAVFVITGEGGRTPDPALLIATAVLATGLILGASAYKTAVLASGGGRVARDLGGTLVPADVSDPQRRRLRNVVEEIAIASAVPVPEIYVLENEMSINAFAAGFTPGDAAIAVTRGTLDVLDRDELQGVVAHEFSHILNGDMRMNIRMMGVLFGILLLGLIGELMLRSSRRTALSSSRRNRSALMIMLIGLGLLILGWIGEFFARLIKAAVSRQRELLADASAVQFTRQTSGIANALKKIGGYAPRSHIRSVNPEEVSHMLFADGQSRLTALFATHPPLTKRIQALDPSFTEADYPIVKGGSGDGAFAPFAPADSRTAAAAPAPGGSRAAPEPVSDAIARPEPQHVAFAATLRRSIPQGLYDAAHLPDEAWLLVLALAIGRDASHAQRQLRLITEQLGAARSDRVRGYFDLLGEVGAEYRLPLLEIAFPALKRRPPAQIDYLLGLVRRLIEADADVDLFEYCLYRVLAGSLSQARDPSGRPRGMRPGKGAVRRAALDLIRAIARHGHDSQEGRALAFRAGVARFGEWARDAPYEDPGARTVALLDRSLNVLEKMDSAGRRSLLEAVAGTISQDGHLSLTEAELLRAVCASLDCPLPPIVGPAGKIAYDDG